MQGKAELRQMALQRRDLASGRERIVWSQEIQNRIRMSPWYREADTVLSYVSFRSEVYTDRINGWVLQDDKELYLPRTYPDRKEMIFYQVEELSSLIPGYQGIPEPQEHRPWGQKPGKTGSHVLMLMPGTAFDRHGNRIGYGGGYYDRFLDLYGDKISNKVMLAFLLQQVPDIAVEECDVPPDQIITNLGEKCE